MSEFNVQGKKISIDEKGNSKLVPVDLTIDTSKVNEKIRQLENQLEEKQTETDHYKTILQTLAEKKLADKRQEISQKYDVDVPDNVQTPQDLMNFEAGLKGRKSSVVAGSAPLYGGQQIPPENEGEDFEQGFESKEDMFSWLHAKEKIKGQSGSKAKQILGEFTKRSLKALKEQPQKTVTYVQQENLKDAINKQFRLQRKLAREERGEGEINE